jgi:hypothetical protein
MHVFEHGRLSSYPLNDESFSPAATAPFLFLDREALAAQPLQNNRGFPLCDSPVGKVHMENVPHVVFKGAV